MKGFDILAIFALILPAESVWGQEVEYVTSLDIGDRVNSIFLSGNYAFLAAETLGLQIVDISVPQAPEIIGEFYPPGVISDVFVQGDFSYLSNSHFGLNIIDVSDPTDPDLVGVYQPYGDGYRRVHVAGDFAYLFDSWGGHCDIVNVADPADLFWISELSAAGWCVEVNDSLAYLTYGSCAYPFDCVGGFLAFDVSDIESPEEIGDYWGWTPGLDISISENLAYLVGGGNFVDDFGELQIIDIADPADPALLGNYFSEDVIEAVAIRESHAYLATEELLIINIEDPYTPSFVTSYPAQGNDVAVAGEYIYVAEGNALTILRFSTTAVDDIGEIPLAFSIAPNYPNPFNATTIIRYALLRASDVTIEIYDILGRKVETLIQGEQQAGNHQVVWDAEGQSSGIYFYRIQAGDYAETRKMVLLK